MYRQVLVFIEKIIYLFQGIGLSDKVFGRYSFFQQGIGSPACHTSFVPTVQEPFAIVQHPGIHMPHEVKAGIFRQVFYHSLDGIGDASLTWSRFGRCA